MTRYNWSSTREELAEHPGKWGMVFETRDEGEANAGLRAWHNHKRYGFQATIRKVEHRRWQVWAMYSPTKFSDPRPGEQQPPKVAAWADTPPRSVRLKKPRKESNYASA